MAYHEHRFTTHDGLSLYFRDYISVGLEDLQFHWAFCFPAVVSSVAWYAAI